MSESTALNDGKPIGKRAQQLSRHLNRIDQAARPRNGFNEPWRKCELLGVPCPFRIAVSLESAGAGRVKDYVVCCTEAYCQLKMGRKHKRFV